MLTLNATSSERLNVDHHRRRKLDKDTVGIQLHKHTYQRQLIILFYLHVFEPPAEQHSTGKCPSVTGLCTQQLKTRLSLHHGSFKIR